MTFEEYIVMANEYYQRYRAPSMGNVRMGQAYYNVLPSEYAEVITGTNKDPFYNDANLPAMLSWLANNWSVTDV